MELAGRGSLEDRTRLPNPPREVARLMVLLSRAVAAAHRAGVLHRDLKPHNILLAEPADEPALNCAWGCPKVADFGLSNQMLAGWPPFRHEAESELFTQILAQPPDPPSAANPAVPRELDAICLRCLEKEPRGGSRPPTNWPRRSPDGSIGPSDAE